MSASEVFLLVKTPPAEIANGQRACWALVEAGCSNQIQVDVRISALVQVAIGCCIKLLLELQIHTVLALITHNLLWWCYFLCQIYSPFTDVLHKHNVILVCIGSCTV